MAKSLGQIALCLESKQSAFLPKMSHFAHKISKFSVVIPPDPIEGGGDPFPHLPQHRAPMRGGSTPFHITTI